MEISPRKHSKRTLEPVDEWLQNEGYFRKHTPKDPTCLFRAISEQIYSTQYYHIRVRKECVEYMRKMKHLFEEYITIPYECYLEQMACFTEWGGINEIQVMSLLYKREIVLFNGQKQTRKLITNNGFKDTIYLCHIPQRQYESVYTKDFITTAGFCQSTVYQILYKDVFGMSNVDGTVHKMLHDRNTALRHDKFFLKGNVEIRDQLVAEIYSKVENNSEEDDGTQSASKNAPPFPYRVAKALDPNIYRNIDFDIWHEIRREVKNAGWTRYNSNELQVGGKCLIQMDFSNEEFDKINSNSSIMHIVDEIQNDNEIKTLQIKENQDPTFFCGHIQEMSKNEGPVLVFIEELGEKRTVPYSSLKPLPLRKNKPTNWLPLCKKNIQLSDTNQKWKKTYNGNLRKVKEPVNSNTVSNNNDNNSSDNNNNNNDNDITTGVNYNNNDKNNSVNSIKQDNSEINQWHRAPSKRDQRQTFGNYVGDKVSNYNINNTNSLAPAKENVQQDMKTDSNENSSENDGICKTPTIPISSMSNKNNIHNFSHSKQKLQKETFCTHYPGNMQVMPSAPTLFYVAPDGNTYPIISPIPSNLVDTIPNNQMDRTLRCINSSALKSNDANGSDLPLSDPLTLRFFYNLGLEYYRISHAWNFGTNGQTIPFGQWHHDIPQYKEEVGNIPSEMQSNCTIVQQNGETNDNDVPESTVQQVDTKMVNVSPKGMQDSVPNYSQKNEGKNSLHLGREKVKDQTVNNRDTPRMNRNGLAPRFKKNPDRSHNNSHQAHVQQNCSNQYQSNVTKPGPSNISDLRKDGAQVHYTNAIPHQAYTPPPISNSCQPSYIQQPMYSGMPFCTNDSEAFTPPYYVPNGAFFPISCMPHSDLSDGNSVNLYSPHFYSGAETYAQTYPAVCAPFMYSQHAPYPGVPQNMHDQWFTIPGQPHYMQYTPIPVSATESCNGVTQNTNLNSSP